MAMASAGRSANASSDPEFQKKLEKVKIEIRSILVSASQHGGLSPDKLDDDYEDINGRRIPWRELGFPNLYSLLDAIPDAISAYRNRYGEIVISAKTSENTAHLEQLIAKQKKAKLGRLGGVEQKPSLSRRRAVVRSKTFNYRSSYTTRTNTNSNGRFRSDLRKPPMANGPRFISGSGTSMKVTINGGAGPSKYSDWLQQQQGQQSQNGNSGPRGSTGNGYGTGQSFNVNRRPTPSFKAPRFAAAAQNKASENGPQSIVHIGISSIVSQTTSAATPASRPVQQQVPSASRTIQQAPPVPRPNQNQVPPGPPARPSPSPSPMTIQATRPKPVNEQNYSGPQPNIEQELRERVSLLLDLYPHGIDLKVFEDAYANYFKERIGTKKEILENDCGDICIFVPNGGRFMIKAKSGTSASTTPTKSIKDQSALPPLSLNEVKEYCEQVLRKYPDGITYLGFPKAYREVSGRELNLEPYGFWSLTELVDSMEDLFRFQQKQGEIMLLAASGNQADSGEIASGGQVQPVERPPSPPDTDELFDEIWIAIWNTDEHSLQVNQIPYAYKIAFGKDLPVADWEAFSIDICDKIDRFDFSYEGNLKVIAQPDYKPLHLSMNGLTIANNGTEQSADDGTDFVSADERYSIQELPVGVGLTALDESERLFQVYMAQVESPDSFYVQLKSMMHDLEKFEIELNEFYSSPSKMVLTPPDMIQPGLPCICRYEEDQRWYRGEVKSVESANEIIVSLVDYGTDIVTKAVEIYRLHRRFFALPAQGIHCKLAFVVAPGETWPTESGNVMSRACGTSILTAEFLYMTDGVPVILLSVTSDDGTAQYLTDILINANLAKLEPGIEDTEDGGSGAASTDGTLDEMNVSNDEDTTVVCAPIPIPGQVDLSFEIEVMEQLQEGLLETATKDDLEVVTMTKTCLTRKLVSLRKKLVNHNESMTPNIVDSIVWLEEQINWLRERQDEIAKLE